MEVIAEGSGQVFGLAPAARLRRQLARLGLAEAPAAGLILRGDHVYTTDVVDALAKAPPGTVLVDPTGRTLAARTEPEHAAPFRAAVAAGAQEMPVGARPGEAAALIGPHDRTLRKRADPVVLPAADPAGAEAALFAASYKGATDILTKHVWPRPALAATRLCARRGITPNQVTAASAVLVLATFVLFWHGWFLTSLAAGFLMTFLDTVDGKLARVTLNASRTGNALDHGIDLIHPPFWWWAWAHGLAAVGRPLDDGGLTLGIIVAVYVAQRLEEGWFLARFGLEIHVWRRFDSLFRQITARRNPNMLILAAATLLGAPRAGLIAVAVWSALCFAIHLVRILQAHREARRGAIGSWLAAE